MTNDEKNKLEQEDIIEEMQEEIEEVENEEGEIDEEKLEEAVNPSANEPSNKCKDILAKTMADFDNFRKRVERDKDDMIFFLKQDIFKKILPRIDDLERIVKNTPEDLQTWALFEWIISLEKKLKKDLEVLWVKAFESIWMEMDADKHDVMTTLPWKEEWIIVDEFEKWYMLWDRILRHAKVVVWAWE